MIAGSEPPPTDPMPPPPLSSISISLASIKLADKVRVAIDEGIKELLIEGKTGYLDVEVRHYSHGDRLVVVTECVYRPPGAEAPDSPATTRYELK